MDDDTNAISYFAINVVVNGKIVLFSNYIYG